jgi:hypothetical protein
MISPYVSVYDAVKTKCVLDGTVFLLKESSFLARILDFVLVAFLRWNVVVK